MQDQLGASERSMLIAGLFTASPIQSIRDDAAMI
jgi:hypothetical protein